MSSELSLKTVDNHRKPSLGFTETLRHVVLELEKPFE